MKTTRLAALLTGAAAFFVVALALPLAARVSGQDPPEPKKDTVDEKTIGALIADLGHEDFVMRDAAHKKLAAIGGPALELLRKAAKDSKDAEARERAAQLIEGIQERGLLSARTEGYHDFRNKGFPNKKLTLFGNSAAQILKAEQEGLRVTLPTDKSVGATGISADFLVKGDFEITVGFDFSERPRPISGSRAGLEIYIMTDTENMEAMAFDRAVRRDGRDVYACSRMTTNNGKRENVYGGEDVPASGIAGQMRIVRMGGKIALSAREDGADDFRVLHRAHLGEEDIKLIRVAANVQYGTGQVDLRLRDLRIRCVDNGAIRPKSEAKTVNKK